MRLTSIQIELAQTSLSAKETSGKTALYTSTRAFDSTNRTAVDGVDGHLVDTVGLKDRLLIGDVVFVILAGELQPERARARARHIITINVHVVDTDSGIRVIYQSQVVDIPTDQRPASIILCSISTKTHALISRLRYLVCRVVNWIIGTLGIANTTLSSLTDGNSVNNTTYVEYIAKVEAKEQGKT